MAHPGELDDLGAGDGARGRSPAAHVDERIGGAVHHERRNVDGLQGRGPVAGGGDGDELAGDPDGIVRPIVRDFGSPADVPLVDGKPGRADDANDLQCPFDGLERAPEALIRMLTGDTVGKTLVRVAGPTVTAA